ncbi:DUF5076 domain-containing protein [Thiohalocapsa sp. ML1]|jgi:hypothetical protein|uniref:DUF5076 domain-containing protein n=1 Tax=Thiohalocapsa sp. ML1 TaxID=1431688 RepID=UPI0009EA3601|nr:DUF5076 domain-containing protein [Thiohalocapsa sp. ML1]
MNERPIPDAARHDADAVEMLRVWIANQGLHCSLKVGMYKESTDIPEERAWGTILADAARHVANALHSAYDANQDESIEQIKRAFLAELSAPTSDADGGFVDP